MLGLQTESTVALKNSNQKLVELGVASYADLAAVNGMGIDEITIVARDANGKLNDVQRAAVLEGIEIRRKEIESLTEYTDKMDVVTGRKSQLQVDIAKSDRTLVSSGLGTADQVAQLMSTASYEDLIKLADGKGKELLDIRKQEVDSLRDFNDSMDVLTGRMTQGQSDIAKAQRGLVDAGLGTTEEIDALVASTPLEGLIAMVDTKGKELNDVQRAAYVEYFNARKAEVDDTKELAKTYTDAFVSISDALQGVMDSLRDGCVCFHIRRVAGCDGFIA